MYFGSDENQRKLYEIAWQRYNGSSLSQRGVLWALAAEYSSLWKETHRGKDLWRTGGSLLSLRCMSRQRSQCPGHCSSGWPDTGSIWRFWKHLCWIKQSGCAKMGVKPWHIKESRWFQGPHCVVWHTRKMPGCMNVYWDKSVVCLDGSVYANWSARTRRLYGQT